jgi:hypothetical protein
MELTAYMAWCFQSIYRCLGWHDSWMQARSAEGGRHSMLACKVERRREGVGAATL